MNEQKMKKSGEAGSGSAGKQKKQQKVKTRKKHDSMRTEVNKAIRMLRNATTDRSLEAAVKRAQPMRAEIRRRAPAVARKFAQEVSV